MLDINSDGVLDSQDAAEAYTQLNKIMSYNMPTGGGFTGGIIMGIRGWQDAMVIYVTNAAMQPWLAWCGTWAGCLATR